MPNENAQCYHDSYSKEEYIPFTFWLHEYTLDRYFSYLGVWVKHEGRLGGALII